MSDEFWTQSNYDLIDAFNNFCGKAWEILALDETIKHEFISPTHLTDQNYQNKGLKQMERGIIILYAEELINALQKTKWMSCDAVHANNILRIMRDGTVQISIQRQLPHFLKNFLKGYRCKQLGLSVEDFWKNRDAIERIDLICMYHQVKLSRMRGVKKNE